MARKLSPGIHNVRVKKPSGGTRMAKVKVLKSGKWKFLKSGSKARAKPRAKPKATRAVKRKSNPKGGNVSTNRAPKIGASYQAARAGAAALSPVTDMALDAVDHGLDTAVKSKVANIKARPDELIAHEIVVGADVVVDKKAGQAAAISRGSVTAIAPEFYTGYKSFLAGREIKGNPSHAARVAHLKAMSMQYGYDAGRNVQDFADRDLKTYRLAKHGGQFLRWARGNIPFVKKMTEPVQKFLSMLGGTI